MKHLRSVVLVIAALSCVMAAAADGIDGSQIYTRLNLVSDIAGVARFTDSNLVNPWGLAFGPTTPFWVADNGAGVSTVYDGGGHGFPVGSPLAVTIPTPTSATGGAPKTSSSSATQRFSPSLTERSSTERLSFEDRRSRRSMKRPAQP